MAWNPKVTTDDLRQYIEYVTKQNQRPELEIARAQVDALLLIADELKEIKERLSMTKDVRD